VWISQRQAENEATEKQSYRKKLTTTAQTRVSPRLKPGGWAAANETLTSPRAPALVRFRLI